MRECEIKEIDTDNIGLNESQMVEIFERETLVWRLHQVFKFNRRSHIRRLLQLLNVNLHKIETGELRSGKRNADQWTQLSHDINNETDGILPIFDKYFQLYKEAKLRKEEQTRVLKQANREQRLRQLGKVTEDFDSLVFYFISFGFACFFIALYVILD